MGAAGDRVGFPLGFGVAQLPVVKQVEPAIGALALIRVGLGMSIMPLWQGLTDITYVPVCGMDLNRTIGLQWRKKQNATTVEWFRAIAEGYGWQI